MKIEGKISFVFTKEKWWEAIFDKDIRITTYKPEGYVEMITSDTS